MIMNKVQSDKLVRVLDAAFVWNYITMATNAIMMSNTIDVMILAPSLLHLSVLQQCLQCCNTKWN